MDAEEDYPCKDCDYDCGGWDARYCCTLCRWNNGGEEPDYCDTCDPTDI